MFFDRRQTNIMNNWNVDRNKILGIEKKYISISLPLSLSIA